MQPASIIRTGRAEFLAGVRAELPLLLGVVPFGAAYGATAVDSGLSSGLAQSMSFIIFGGASQFVAVELFAASVPGIVVALTVALVNLRHLLYSASLAPHVAHLPPRWRWFLAYLLTDEAYAVGITRYRDGTDAPGKHWYLLGAGCALWASWQVSTGVGVFAGAVVPDSWSLDFALPLTFIALLVPALTGRGALAAAVVAGAVAVAAHGWPYGTWLITAALAGIVAGMAAERTATERAREAA
ncbi:MAG: AzlC family ABC transporter permease [Dehalococcoidia bacterium]